MCDLGSGSGRQRPGNELVDYQSYRTRVRRKGQDLSEMFQYAKSAKVPAVGVSYAAVNKHRQKIDNLVLTDSRAPIIGRNLVQDGRDQFPDLKSL
ncbi:hypothetical protein E3N88_11319 [Mikania micrantha]|uniref:Uncharacterized protein n=1 Tax=Mikania micrantha TaxID=192012 RepID=A0A5N6LK83_9ASTR|nr:hypothetical protein E3N88_41609 [Mikania micrantha]KAD6120048.1 hypothetical protein E3N88_11319 [Mikania micrantha]